MRDKIVVWICVIAVSGGILGSVFGSIWPMRMLGYRFMPLLLGIGACLLVWTLIAKGLERIEEIREEKENADDYRQY